jgi:hypothetical protein
MLGKIGDLLGKVIGVVDDVITSDEERLALKAPLFEMQAKVLALVLAGEKQMLDAQTQIVQAETQSDNWLTRMWRPLTMVTFVVVSVLSWSQLGPPMPEWMEEMIKLGLGGYLGGRSLEKIIPQTALALKAREVLK